MQVNDDLKRFNTLVGGPLTALSAMPGMRYYKSCATWNGAHVSIGLYTSR